MICIISSLVIKHIGIFSTSIASNKIVESGEITKSTESNRSFVFFKLGNTFKGPF